MNLPGRKTTIFVVIFVAFVIFIAFGLLTFSRRVDGISMLPTLEEGDLVVIQQVPFSSIHVGDIIVYGGTCSDVYLSGSPVSVIHRVVQNTSLGLITKGDNNPYTDQAGLIARTPITAACVEGKVVFVIPYLERLAALPDGLNYVLAAALLIGVAAYEIWGQRRAGQEPPGATTVPEPSPGAYADLGSIR